MVARGPAAPCGGGRREKAVSPPPPAPPRSTRSPRHSESRRPAPLRSVPSEGARSPGRPAGQGRSGGVAERPPLVAAPTCGGSGADPPAGQRLSPGPRAVSCPRVGRAEAGEGRLDAPRSPPDPSLVRPVPSRPPLAARFGYSQAHPTSGRLTRGDIVPSAPAAPPVRPRPRRAARRAARLHRTPLPARSLHPPRLPGGRAALRGNTFHRILVVWVSLCVLAPNQALVGFLFFYSSPRPINCNSLPLMFWLSGASAAEALAALHSFRDLPPEYTLCPAAGLR